MLNKKALAGTPSTPPAFVEDVFSTYLYTGTGSAQTINNGLDLSGKGGLTWLKTRTGTITGDHYLIDTARGNSKLLVTTTTDPDDTDSTLITAFNNNGFSLGTNGVVNTNTRTYCSWTFRKAPKFFDIVTYTGTGSATTISHNLGSVPGMIIVKARSTTSNWTVYHRSASASGYTAAESVLKVNLNDAVTDATAWNNTAPTSSVFSVGAGSPTNSNGITYIAYLFAHNAGGFGTAGTDNVISCGSFTADGSGGYSVNLGYEPQYVFLKRTSGTGNWFILDVMRGAGVGTATTQELKANLVAAESTNAGNLMSPNATGFGVSSTLSNLDAGDYIYMAIRRPMKVPTTGTSVFSPVKQTAGTNYDVTFTGMQSVDAVIKYLDISTGVTYNAPMWNDRLRGFPTDMTGNTQANNPGLASSSTAAEATGSDPATSNYLSGVTMNRAVWGGGWTGYNGVFYGLKRASGFFDVVCYTGTGVARTVAHNLTVVPELMIVKRRNTSGTNWLVYATGLGATKCTTLNTTDSQFTSASFWNDTAPTSSVFTVGTSVSANNSGDTYVAYLFATLAGISKVGSYTGNGSNQTINCGFTAGARFVMVRRVDDVGNWVVWDTARGIVSGNDPYLLLNSTAAEVTNTDAIDPDNSGFVINRLAAIDVNENGGSYIFMAIA